MKQFTVGFILLVLTTGAFANNAITVMSYNIRCGLCEAPENPHNWKKRKYFVAHLIKTHNPDVIGLQEAELFQVEDLVEMLDDYSWMGVGRDDGRDKGETTAILFRTARFSLQAQQTLWLSQTPLKPSLGWDATYRRTLSIAKLLDAQTKQFLHVFNIHLDNEGETARQEGAKLLLGEIAKLDAASPIAVTGDFNLTAPSATYDIITQVLADAEKTSITPAVGGGKTFNGFGENKEPNNKIDFIFVKKSTKVQSHQVDTTIYNNIYPSDHYPVIVNIDTSAAPADASVSAQ
ncbi:MAG TPA: endonuclease/exonuclease/phosphatase family protein [Cellvibrio sp.]